MNNHTKRWSGRVFWGFIGVFLLYVVGRFLITEYYLRQYEEIFSQVEHPQGTSLVDTISLRFRYYPATYTDDAIDFQAANLVGELRSYRGDWNEIKGFYSNPRSENGRPIAVIPTEIHKKDEQIWLEVAGWHVGDPSNDDIVEGIREQYDFWGWPESLNSTRQGLYLVYVLGQ